MPSSGVHYEHDGFTEATVRQWFAQGNMDNPNKVWDLDHLEITRVPLLCPVDPDFRDLVPERKEEVYNILVITCVVK